MVNEKGDFGSRFLVVNSMEFTDEIKDELMELFKENTSLSEAFIEHGGIPNYAQRMTIFAQTYEGLDIIDTITAQDIDTDNENRPTQDIIIETIEITTYAEASK